MDKLSLHKAIAGLNFLSIQIMDRIKKNNFYKKRWYAKKKKGTTEQNKEQVSNANNTSAKDSQNVSKEDENTSVLYTNKHNTNIPYYGWTLYFDEKEYKKSSNIVTNVEAMERFLKRNLDISSSLTISSLEGGVTFPIDLHNLYNDEIFLTEWSNFKTDLREEPTRTLNCIKLAIHQSILNTVPNQNLKSITNRIYLLPVVKVQILNHEQAVYLRDIKVNSYGKLITTRGCVVKVGRTKQLAQWFVFACCKCGSEKIQRQPEGVYTVPKKCNVCTASAFEPVLDSQYVMSIPFQTITLQEILNNEQETKGRVPRVLDVNITSDLVDTCMPGDDLTLTGIIKVRGIDDSNSIKGNVATSLSLYMEAVTIIHNSNSNDKKCINTDTTINETNMKDYLAIKEIYDNKSNIFPLLVHSLCPGIYGYEMIKAGLLLSLLGGNGKHKGSRDQIHVLVVGDPGLGKSQMLQSCTRVSTKGVYICGNSSTSSGLTVTLTKETGTNDFALEPGALVLADGGCCCIDEFDKMSPQHHQALLESMEQQSVSVAKSGILCSLPSRTSILAAANPIGGRYDRGKTISQNLNISQPLLSRFDLIFLLLDDPDQHRDRLICNHIMASHINPNGGTQSNAACEDISSRKSESRDNSLREKFTSLLTQTTGTIPQIVLKKYISYARQYVNPKLTAKAAEVLQKYYLELRSRNAELSGSIPIYNRQLEAMIRLTEARAKLELRVEATEFDALEIVEIMEYTIANMLENPFLKLPPSISNNKFTEKKVKTFIKLLENEMKSSRQKTFSTRELKEIAANGGINAQDFPQLLSKMNEQGVLLQIERNVYKFIKM